MNEPQNNNLFLGQINEQSNDIPEYLCKYGALSEAKNQKYLEETFLEDKVYFSSPLDFNDPFDSLPTDSSVQTTIKIIADRNGDPINSTQKFNFRETTMRNFGVYCVSESYDNILMWSHYASRHTGYCIRFNLSKLKNDKEIWESAIKVIYSHNRADFDISKHEKDIYKVLHTKSILWEYEREWRIIKDNLLHNDTRKIALPANCIEGIILGCEMIDKNKCIITDMIKSHNLKINIYEAKIDSDKFKLNIERIY